MTDSESLADALAADMTLHSVAHMSLTKLSVLPCEGKRFHRARNPEKFKVTKK